MFRCWLKDSAFRFFFGFGLFYFVILVIVVLFLMTLRKHKNYVRKMEEESNSFIASENQNEILQIYTLMIIALVFW